MKSILNKLNLLVLGTVLLLTFPGCSDDNTSDLKLDGDTWLTALELNDTYTGVIDRTNKTVTVAVPEVYDTDAMKVTGIEVSEGAEASVKAGDVLNFSFPQVIKVTNGNVFLDYTVNIKHDEARILSFKLNDAYAGVIDQTKRTITVRVPSSVNIKNMVPIITTSTGATVMPASGQAIDFSNPVEFTVSYNTASCRLYGNGYPDRCTECRICGSGSYTERTESGRKGSGNLDAEQYCQFAVYLIRRCAGRKSRPERM